MALPRRSRRTSPRKRRRPLRRSLPTQERRSKSNNWTPILFAGTPGIPSFALKRARMGRPAERMGDPANLNRRGDFWYLIDTAVSLPNRCFQNWTQERRGARAKFALLEVVARPAGIVLIETGPR